LARRAAVNAIAIVLLLPAPGFATQVLPPGADWRAGLFERFACSNALARIFAPPNVAASLSRRSEVCQSTAALEAVLPAGWFSEAVAAADLFAAADPHVKRRVAMLYGGQRPLVARGWIATEGTLESLTLISPRPDPASGRLLPGTLLIRVVTNR
jgi:hypothetical protein